MYKTAQRGWRGVWLACAAWALLSGVSAHAAEPAFEAAADYGLTRGGEAVVIVQRGHVVIERYARDGGPEVLQWLASISKSLVGLAAIAAVDDGRIRLDDHVADAIPAWRDDPQKARITYRQLLTQTSGIEASKRGASFRPDDWSTLPALPMTGVPGGQFDYGALQHNLFAYALEQRLGGERFEAWLQRRVLDPLGVTLTWRIRGEDGRPQVAGGGSMRARDLARVGEAVRTGAGRPGQPLFSPRGLAALRDGSAANPAYGLGWWLKVPLTREQRRAGPLQNDWSQVANAPDLPADLIAALGVGNQRLFIVPSRQLVAVRLGRPGLGFSDTVFLQKLLGLRR